MLFIVVLTGCSGGGGTSSSGAVQGLQLPATLSVVSAQDEDSSSPTLAFKEGRIAARTANADYEMTGTDYTTDEAHSYVYDASMESLGTVNMILCLMDQTRATDMVNKGPYITLVNEDKCEQGENQSSSGSTGQSSGGQATEFNSWTVVSTRENNGSPQIVKIWVPGEDDENDPMDGQTILVETTATEGISASKPFGSFSLNFKGVVDASAFGGVAGTEIEMMTGTLQSVDNSEGQPQFRFVNLGGDVLGASGADFSFEEAANVVLDDANGSGGVALTHRAESFSGGGGPSMSQQSTFAIAFDTDHLLRGKDDDGDNFADESECKSRTDFDTQVWHYNLYHAAAGSFNGSTVTAGQRVSLNSGFPFSYDSNSDGTNDAYGWVGYHGVWSENGALADGTTITEFDYESDSVTEHTVNVAPGKMIRRSASSESLTGFQGDEFRYWGEHPTLNIFGQWSVIADSNNDFQVTGTFEWGDNGPETSTTVDHDEDPSTEEISAVAAFSLNNNDNLLLWSDALGGNVVYVHDNSLAAADREVTFYGEEFISPADSTLFPSGTTSVALYCYERCLKGGFTQADVTAAAGNNGVDDLYYSYAGTPFQYTLSATNGKVIITDDSNSDTEVSAVGLDLSALGYDWGINTGEMLITPLSNPSNPWEVYNEDVSYRWETGDNEWNQMVTVSDVQGNVSTFDRPLQFTYTHSAANDANANSGHNGDKFLLQYGGEGELWGFPWEEDSDTGRWYAAVTLADGVQLGNGFVVKAIEKEQTMQTDAGGCTALNIGSLFTDPALALPTASDIGTVSFTLAEKPVVTDAPAVIEGELQQ